MKKFYLIVCFGLSYLALFAQRAEVADLGKVRSLKSVSLKSSVLSLKTGIGAEAKTYESSVSTVVWDNGPLVNSPGTGYGGADESVVQSSLGMIYLGFGFQEFYSNSVADDFTLSRNEIIDSIVVFGYQTGSSTASTITEVYLRIYDGDPRTGGNIIWGDFVTNRLVSSKWSGIYRVMDYDSGNNQRPIMECICDVDAYLSAGTYWLEIQMNGPLASGPWCPTVSINGETTTGNGIQNAGGWGEIWDVGQQGVPFVLLSSHSLEVTLFPNGKYALTQEDKEILSGDPEKYQSIEVSPRSFDCNSVGEPVPVTISVVDTSGVPSTFSGYVLVYDETAPEAKCKDITVTLDDSGEASIFGGQIDDGSYDACGIKNRVLDKYNFYCADLGKDTITLTVGDASGNLSSCTSEVTVLTVNKMPALNSIADVTVDEDSAVTVDLTGISYGDDCEAQDLVVSVTVSDSAMIDTMGVDYTSGDPEGTLSISPAADMSGSTVVTVTVEDEEGASVSQNFTLTINPVNDAPFLVIPIPDQTIYASYELNIPVSSVLGVIFDDVDDDELEMSVMVEGTDTLPSWATMSADILVCEPMIADTGCVNIVVMATDSSGASASDTFEVCVAGYPTAIGELEAAGPEIQMYPNPTNGQVNLEMSSGIHAVDIAVVDIAGRVVLQKQYSASERIVFDMSGKVAGMYFVNMKIDGERVVKKLIVDNR
ncbi:T9SS type A sorting domain-containing protein [Maribellus comscasis]|uniref:T9SS type A sorting domain-containing protein n=1 Tax=Maribellus comscasis TaxID=2681766 RepID=A0A6I6JQH5_9BACT|nr:T9SS type A sorting domain-containing protein [Maribellus comscasis]QGY45235.1 T9SS type A sorting domain-containing protein [Maribellus comscasis]